MSSNVEQRLVQLQKEFCQLQEDSESVEREQTERIEELEMLVDSLKENEQKLKQLVSEKEMEIRYLQDELEASVTAEHVPAAASTTRTCDATSNEHAMRTIRSIRSIIQNVHDKLQTLQ